MSFLDHQTRLPVRKSLMTKGEKKKQILRENNIPYGYAKRSTLSKKDILTPTRPLSTKKYFVAKPTMEALEKRSTLPDDWSKPKLIGHPEQINVLYEVSRKMALAFFEPSIAKELFPSGFSTLKTQIQGPYQSKLPTKQSSLLLPAFETLNTLLAKKTQRLYALSDFVLIYCALVLVSCGSDINAEKCLCFLKAFMNSNQFPFRPKENAVLFSALVNERFGEATVRGFATQVIGILAERDQSVMTRLQAGEANPDQGLAIFCRDCLSMTSRGQIPQQQPIPPTLSPQLRQQKQEPIQQEAPTQPLPFTEIPHNSDENSVSIRLDRMLEALMNSVPLNPLSLAQSVFVAFERHGASPEINSKAANCLSSLLHYCESLDPIFLGNVLRVAYTYQSRDTRDLVEMLYQQFPPALCVEAAKSMISQLNDQQKDLLSKDLHALFPDFMSPIKSPISSSEISDSVLRLMSADTVFDEMEKIVGMKNPHIIGDYPLYLHSFLQRAYYLYNNTDPPYDNENQQKQAHDMARVAQNLERKDVTDGKYSPDFLAQRLKEIQNTLL